MPASSRGPPDLHTSINSRTSANQTQTTNDNILNFRIQIAVKGRKLDFKFPFDLRKDTPEAVAEELQDYFK